ncbi:MAG TPA: peptidylprolyl isomerase SurA, partial [Candidatus Goldiibacteriota bacterium]|nr:peptidylprolyl isomerase SurA [Candidatus Goldiibacteriota bacterium]
MKKAFFLAVLTMMFAALSQAKLADRILVKVNDEVILQSEVDESVNLLLSQMKMSGKSGNRDSLSKEVIKNLVEQ